MKILFIATNPPFPPLDGARLIVAQLVRALSKQHTLYLAALCDGTAVSPELERYFAGVRLVRRPPVTKARRWLRSLFDELPLWARIYVSKELAAVVQDLILHNAIDVVHADTGGMAVYLPVVNPPQSLVLGTKTVIPVVLAPHDSLTRVLEQRIAHAANAQQRLTARLQVGKMRRFESTRYADAARVVVVTEREKEFLQGLAPTLPVRVIPNGVDSDFFAPQGNSAEPRGIGFHGVMNYSVNTEAALFLARRVMPRLWREEPSAVFTVIGRDPPREIQALAQDARIRVTGTVDDVRPHIAAQAVMVVPVKEAGGIKNKLLEAMAMGKPVVATREAAEGIDAHAGEDFLVARGADEFAGVCLRLIHDEAERARLGANARAWALKHTWERAAEQYAAVYQEAIDAALVR